MFSWRGLRLIRMHFPPPGTIFESSSTILSFCMEVSVYVNINAAVVAIVAVADLCCTAAATSRRATATLFTCCFTFSDATELAIFTTVTAFFMHSILASPAFFAKVVVSDSWWAASFFSSSGSWDKCTSSVSLHVHALIMNSYDCYHDRVPELM